MSWDENGASRIPRCHMDHLHPASYQRCTVRWQNPGAGTAATARYHAPVGTANHSADEESRGRDYDMVEAGKVVAIESGNHANEPASEDMIL
jgi:hypothetical protein